MNVLSFYFFAVSYMLLSACSTSTGIERSEKVLYGLNSGFSWVAKPELGKMKRMYAKELKTYCICPNSEVNKDVLYANVTNQQ